MANIIGQLTCNETKILEVDGDPSTGGGVVAPTGTLAFVTATAGFWKKFNTGNTDWTAIVYGENFQISESAAQTDNNSQVTYVSKTTLVTPSTLPSGDYQLETQALVFHGTSARSVQISLLRNTVEFANVIVYIGLSTAREVVYAKHRFAAISGTNTFDFQFRSVGNGTASISNMAFRFKRVA